MAGGRSASGLAHNTKPDRDTLNRNGAGTIPDRVVKGEALNPKEGGRIGRRLSKSHFYWDKEFILGYFSCYHTHSSPVRQTHPTSRGATSVLTCLALYLASFLDTFTDRACVRPGHTATVRLRDRSLTRLWNQASIPLH